ncbi:MAG: dienelactone hydrolase [Chloroflexi bacterium]|nr:dienelactone hydrolase [Chloroflexota bacterium]
MEGIVNKRFWVTFFAVMLALVIPAAALAQGPDDFVFGDPLPDAPELAPRGDFGVGVRTLELVNPDQLDILNVTEDNPEPLVDRALTVEVWYPAVIPEGEDALTSYEDMLGRSDLPDRPLIPYAFAGRALRDAEPLLADTPYPLVIVSHGYPGSRYMLTNLTENLASKGYIVAAIGHTESTFDNTGPVTSSLYHRPYDILFTLDQMAELGVADGESFLAGLVDADNTALLGYSLGGYGVLNAAGAGVGPLAVAFVSGQTGSQAMAERQVGNVTPDPRIKCVIALAPWGMNVRMWTADGLAGIDVPVFIAAGSLDDVAGYENGVVPVYEGLVNADRYLLTYANARHNVAPNPPPPEAYAPGLDLNEWLRYDDSVWDERRINNINQHFLTAFLGLYLREDASYAPYLDVIEVASEGVYAVDETGQPQDDHTYWRGFLPRTAVGLTLEYRQAGE